MAAYNETPTQLAAALNSLQAQTLSDFEVEIVLDAPDNQALRDILTQWQANDARFHLHINADNMGLANSLNVALSHATGTYIARMDADDLAMPKRFERQVALMKANGVAVLSTNATFIDERGQVVGEHDWIPEEPAQLAELLPLGSDLIHPSVMMLASALRAVNGYRPLPTAEDYDLWLRFLKAGFAIGATNERLLQYRLRGNSMTQGDRYKVFLVTAYLQAAYRRPAYPDAQTQVKELNAWLTKHQQADAAISARFTQNVKNLSEGKQALKAGHVLKAMHLTLPALMSPPVRAYAQQSQRFNKKYQQLRRQGGNYA
ncbi:glycosyl transferase 2 family protein [Lacticaseibacillus brantae DSM 23927]|uniref:Glycosyl transferase 2 family protein n=2 Tax=Lacticaseibacillus brantae TaxID=943673 RepID=A0A0R2BAB4_9LACO|nr:glycosyl transferase 2 family protein [Lacticaseibacillus brantae DSM 23927]